MSQLYHSKSKPKSPYKTLLSCNKTRTQQDTTRKIYCNELPLKRYTHAKSTEEEDNRRYHSSTRNVMRDLQLNLKCSLGRSHGKEPFSDRKNMERKQGSLIKN